MLMCPIRLPVGILILSMSNLNNELEFVQTESSSEEKYEEPSIELFNGMLLGELELQQRLHVHDDFL